MLVSQTLQTIRNRLPSSVKRFARYVNYSAQDFISYVTRSREPLIPSKRTIFIGNGDFKRIGDAFMNSLVKGADLRPDGSVLDVGSGQGRVARPLTGYLDGDGAYYGIEIVKSAVDWCNKEYKKFPNFNFIHADIFNTHYNVNGRISVQEYEFPFQDNTFDVIFLSSVFTHMRPDDVRHYLSEIARCLKPGKRCMATCFLLNGESRNAIREKKTALAFRYEVDENCMTTTEDDPEDAIAMDEIYILEAYAEAGLEVLDVRYGKWVPRDKSYGFQDMIIARKRRATANIS